MSPLAHETEAPDGPGVTTHLCDWIHGLKLEDVPVHVQTRAKYLILDGLACALTGALVPWSVDAAKAVLEFEEPGKHVVIGYREVFLFLVHTKCKQLARCSRRQDKVLHQLNIFISRKWDRWPQRY